MMNAITKNYGDDFKDDVILPFILSCSNVIKFVLVDLILFFSDLVVKETVTATKEEYLVEKKTFKIHLEYGKRVHRFFTLSSY